MTSKFAASVRRYWEAKKKKSLADNELNAQKEAFYDDMDRYFKRNKTETSVDFKYSKSHYHQDALVPTLRVVRIEPTKVVFDAMALEKALGKKRAKKVIKKTHLIKDWAAFAKLMKRHGVPVAQVAKLIDVQREVDVKALEQLDAIGELDDVESEELMECSHVEKGKRYYKLTEVRNAF